MKKAMSLFHKENRRLLKVLVGITLAGCLLFFWKFPYGMGFLTGTILSVIIYEWNVHYWNGVLDTGHARRGTGFPHFLINYALMGGLMLGAVYKPEILNIFTTAIGLMSVKSAIIVKELIFRKEAVQ